MTREEMLSALGNLRYVKRWKDKKGLADETIDICIEALEQTRWIPVSERWPEDYAWVIVCFASGCVTTGYHYADNNTYPSEDCDETGWYDCDEELCDQEVIAWMPFPKPYKEG